MKIKLITSRSIASGYDISEGDELLEINGHLINDVIDYKFYAADSALELKLESQQGEIKTILVEKPDEDDLGLEFCPVRYKSCNNNCIFCFVHQLPKGLRRALYFKDEDFRLSFLHGNFITLTNTLDNDIKRIVNQRLSPLYVSVHATDGKLRKEILGNPNVPEILPLIERLAKERIDIHAQIVLCPGINDGEYLEKSIQDLSGFYPYVKSLALVPVGLTKFREKLPEIKPVSKIYSKGIILQVDDWQKLFRKRWGSGFVYAADEFFTKAELGIPPASYYDEFYQIENGVGMMRQFMNTIGSKRRSLPKDIGVNLKITLITGASAQRLIKKIAKEISSSVSGLKIQPEVVRNDFFGDTVTVSGLLAGIDILNALRKQKKLGDIVLLPPNCLNEDGLFLDDLTPKDLEKELRQKVIIGSYDLVETLNGIFEE